MSTIFGDDPEGVAAHKACVKTTMEKLKTLREVIGESKMAKKCKKGKKGSKKSGKK